MKGMVSKVVTGALLGTGFLMVSHVYNNYIKSGEVPGFEKSHAESIKPESKSNKEHKKIEKNGVHKSNVKYENKEKVKKSVSKNTQKEETTFNGGDDFQPAKVSKQGYDPSIGDM